MPKLTSPLKWHGGKYYLAPKIVRLLPPHLHYVEPYAGSLAVLLQKDPRGVSEVVNDLHGELMNFWMVLADENLFAKFVHRAQVTPFSETLFEQAGDPSIAEESPSARAYWFFVRCRQSRAGCFGEFATLTRRRTRRGMNEQAAAWLSAVEGLPQVHARLQRVVILRRDALDVIKSQDGPASLFYLDPPYLHDTRASTGQYQHEMSRDEHVALLERLATIQGKFLLSGYPSALYDEYASRHGWRHVDFQLPNNAAGGKTKRRMTERVWMNYAPPHGQEDL